MHHSRLEYKGHLVEVMTPSTSQGWTWSYMLNQRPSGVCLQSPLPTKQMAVEDALIDAQMTIDSVIVQARWLRSA
jgi:hypothetical protein